jgi:hypothetical protein
MFAYTADTNTLWLYDGSAWVSAINATSLNNVAEDDQLVLSSQVFG